MKPSIGAFSANGKTAWIDLPRLLETRMIVQAASGYGKSWALRRVLEQTAGQVQQLVIDPEGEFATLREKHDYIIAAAHDGDALAHPRTAQLLARRLLETGVSAILDIYDLKSHERQSFVRLFLEALVEAPKSLWRPCLIVLDEAHVYCPESSKAEAAGAVIDLATRGRKRGFALIAATQRLSKFNKDAAAELLNKLIGKCGLDVDIARAADDLGFTRKDANQQFRLFGSGQFFEYGPALSPEVQLVMVGQVETTHPKAGQRRLKKPPPATSKIKAILPKLSDLPKEAETEARTMAELKRELLEVRRELSTAKRAQPKALPPPKAAAVKVQIDPQLVAKATQQAHQDGYIAGRAQLAKEAEQLVRRLPEALQMLVASSKPRSVKQLTAQAMRELRAQVKAAPPQPSFTAVKTPIPTPQKLPRERPANFASNGQGNDRLSKVERKFLTVLAQRQDRGTTRNQLAIFAGYSSKSGHIDNTLSKLRSAGNVQGGSDNLQIMQAGIDALGPYDELPSGERLRAYWLGHAGGKAHGAMLKVLFDAHPQSLTRDQIADAAGYSIDSGHVDNVLSRLRSLELIAGSSQAIKASDDLFL